MTTNPSEKTSARPGLLCQVPRSGVIQVKEKLCTGCRECEVFCSLSHEGQCNPELARIRVDTNDFQPGLPGIRACKQCDWPACYYACAAKWDEPAIRIDERTGARYVDESLCRGCGACAKACPLTPERPVVAFKKVERKRVYFKCDLCKDRTEGPLCAEVCPGGALTYIPAEERKG
jgi:anaerobic carbon-monoxide dehydrogenase iron sulfur subunit